MNKVEQKVYITPENKDKIKRIADARKVSSSTLVRHWLENYLDIIVFPEDEQRSAENVRQEKE